MAEAEWSGPDRPAVRRRRPAGVGSAYARVVMDLLQAAGRPMRLRELMEAGVHQQYVAALASEGLIERVARGCYRPSLKTERSDPWEFLAAAAMRWPQAVVCGPTAAALHGIATEDGGPVWLAVARGRPRPKGNLAGREVRVREWLAPRMALDVVTWEVSGVLVRVVSRERALAELRELAPRIGREHALAAAAMMSASAA